MCFVTVIVLVDNTFLNFFIYSTVHPYSFDQFTDPSVQAVDQMNLYTCESARNSSAFDVDEDDIIIIIIIYYHD